MQSAAVIKRLNCLDSVIAATKPDFLPMFKQRTVWCTICAVKKHNGGKIYLSVLLIGNKLRGRLDSDVFQIRRFFTLGTLPHIVFADVKQLG